MNAETRKTRRIFFIFSRRLGVSAFIFSQQKRKKGAKREDSIFTLHTLLTFLTRSAELAEAFTL